MGSTCDEHLQQSWTDILPPTYNMCLAVVLLVIWLLVNLPPTGLRRFYTCSNFGCNMPCTCWREVVVPVHL